MRNYATLHSETDWGKGTDCSKKEYGCKWTWDYPTSHSDTDWSKGTWETMQHYTQTQMEVKEQLVVRKNMDVTEHERLYNITLRYILK